MSLFPKRFVAFSLGHFRTSLTVSVAVMVTITGCTPSTFQATIGSVGYEQPLGITPTPDGGYAVCGFRLEPTPSLQMTKLDATGDVVWQRSPANPAAGLRGGCLTAPGGAQVVSSSEMANENNQLVLWKLDGEGNELSDIRLETTGDEVAIAAAPAGNGQIVVTGWYQDRSALGVRVLLTEVDAAGVRLWSEAIDHAGNQHGEDVTRLASGDFIVVGNAGNGSMYTARPYVERTDPTGHPIWQRTYDDLGVGSLEAVVERPDGTILAGGHRGSSVTTGLLVALDGSGGVLWTQEDDTGVTNVEDLIASSDGSVLAAGTWNEGSSANDSFLARLDANGDQLWLQHYGGASVEYAMDASATPDGGFVFAGGTDSYGAGDMDIYVVKTDSAGTTGPAPS